jgi:hypothetical protein
MGEAEIISGQGMLLLRAHIITYGEKADEDTTERMRREIQHMWNEPLATLIHKGVELMVQFEITASCIPELEPEIIFANTDPRNNYFRIEEKSDFNISFVDGLGCNSGYFQYDNLYEGSTTAAHEFGHTLGLDHPADLDIRGMGAPGIMYPRGTLVDPEFQYDPAVPAGLNGGTMHPRFRKVRPEDIRLIRLTDHKYVDGRTVVGSFSNVYHRRH